MIKTTAIDQTEETALRVVWDTGRRCNYDCSYCESTRHNNTSKHKSLDELIKSYHFIKEYADLYNTHRTKPDRTHINFTGGEPTANPNFWKLIDYIKSQPDQPLLTLTTNGAWSIKYSDQIIQNFASVTVSYHAEAHESLRENVVKNILLLKNSNINLSVNMMLHTDLWDHCVEVYDLLKSNGVNVRPRPIGDGAITIKGWFQDADGTMRRTSHEYTAEQQNWFFKESGINQSATAQAQGTEMGRACCGGVCLKGKVEGQWQPIKLVDTHFKDWYCMVNWFFLYVDQETGDISHHQTCKALFDKKRGIIGNLSNTEEIFKFVKDNINNYIVCPNNRCGCGMCVPKAQDFKDFSSLRKSLVIE